MGKKNKPSLGKSIIRQRVKSSGNIKHANSWLHCSELDNDNAPNIQSITEQSALDDFLATAELAGTEFTAEKLNTTIVTPKNNEGLLTSEAVMAIKQAQQEHQHFLRIPRRPEWDENMTAEELDQIEKESFLQWRRQLAQLQEKDHILLTPFERNLDFWRQLWRVIERSDIVVQIVDARNPLLFRCEDLENYVTDIDPKKCNLLLINKADLLSPEQRESWARYFTSIGLPVAFWSAQRESERLSMATDTEERQKEKDKEEKMEREGQDEELQEKGTLTLWSRLAELAVDNEVKGTRESQETVEDSSVVGIGADGPIKSDLHMSDFSVTSSEDRIASVMSPSNSTKDMGCEYLPSNVQSCHSEQSAETEKETDNQSITEKELPLITNLNSTTDCRIINEVSLEKMAKELNSCNTDGSQLNSDTYSEHEHSCEGLSANLLTRDELLALFKMLYREKQQSAVECSQKLLTTVGLVGYPNVGKSSTINTLLNDKKVPVSATPGRTKHFQTLYVNDEVLLCDCPGLVFPSFVSTKAEMILNGILPIDQMRDHVPAISLLCQRIPRGVLEVVYGLNIAPPQEGEDPTRAPYADELLSAYGYIRGFMTSHGTPDCSRSARYILKDYVKGKLLYCIAPPGLDEAEFQQIGYKLQNLADVETKDREARERARKQMSDVDKNFFKQEQVRCFSRGFHTTESRQYGIVPPQDPSALLYKPWKKHHNKNKREKLRRLVKN